MPAVLQISWVPLRQGEDPAGPSPATPTCRPGRPVTQPLSRLSLHMNGSHVAVVVHLPFHSTRLDCHHSWQLQVTVDSYRGGVRRVGGPLISSPSFHFILGTYLNPLFALSKSFNYMSNLIFMFGWSGLYRVLRMTHLEAAPTMRITGC